MRRAAAVAVALLLLLYPHPLADLHVQPSGSRYAQGRQMMMVMATAYCYSGHHTKSGTWPQRGTIAVDPTVIPLGTRLYVEGYGPAMATDTGSLIKGARIDEYRESAAECVQFGRRTVAVWIED
jgi:3D (Asp-Asp-Asp) domain-containing protein